MEDREATPGDHCSTCCAGPQGPACTGHRATQDFRRRLPMSGAYARLFRIGRAGGPSWRAAAGDHRGLSSVGRASAWQAEGREFKSPRLHFGQDSPGYMTLPGDPGRWAPPGGAGTAVAEGSPDFPGCGFLVVLEREGTPHLRRGCSSAGRASRSHRGGPGFDSPQLHLSRGELGAPRRPGAYRGRKSWFPKGAGSAASDPERGT